MKQKNVNEQSYFKPKNNKKFFVKIIIVCIILNSIFITAIHFGFISMAYSIEEPIGNSQAINVEEYLDEIPALAEMPNLDKIEYKTFGTDASIDAVNTDYEKRLSKNGYNSEYSGDFEIDGINFEVNGFLKGLTAVAIVTTEEDIGDYNFNSYVFYATGNALDFQEILNWYNNI